MSQNRIFDFICIKEELKTKCPINDLGLFEECGYYKAGSLIEYTVFTFHFSWLLKIFTSAYFLEGLRLKKFEVFLLIYAGLIASSSTIADKLRGSQMSLFSKHILDHNNLNSIWISTEQLKSETYFHISFTKSFILQHTSNFIYKQICRNKGTLKNEGWKKNGKMKRNACHLVNVWLSNTSHFLRWNVQTHKH